MSARCHLRRPRQRLRKVDGRWTTEPARAQRLPLLLTISGLIIAAILVAVLLTNP